MEIEGKKRNGICKGLFVCDLDGTLLNDRKRIDAKDLDALSRLRRKGYRVALATGRSNYSFESLLISFDDLRNGKDLPVDYVIFSTGAGIMEFKNRRPLKNTGLAPEDVRFLVSRLDSWKMDYMVHRPIPDTRDFYFRKQRNDNPDFHARLNLYWDFAAPLTPKYLEETDGATEVICIFPEQEGHERASFIERSFRQYSVVKATSPLDHKSIWVEIFSSSTSKGRAAEWLAECLDIARENVCAVGNDYNDEDLLKWAGSCYVVANAAPSLQERFQAVAANNHAGVGEAVDRWLACLGEGDTVEP